MFDNYLLRQLSMPVFHYAARQLAAAVLALALAGCVSGPDYRLPATPESAAGHFVTQVKVRMKRRLSPQMGGSSTTIRS
jgi:hypothetical protein